MTIGVLGASHQHAGIAELESIYINGDGIGPFLETLSTSSPIQELVILTTCNRIEYYFYADSCEEAAVWLKEYLNKTTKTPIETISKILKFRKNEAAIEHLFSVASGIKSMVFGENEILTQVKESYERSKEAGSTGPVLNKLFQMAVATGKRARTETGISRGAYSVSSIAVEAIRERVLDYFGRKILIIGLGTMGSRSLKKLVALGHPSITVANRTFEKAIAASREYGVSAMSLEEALKIWKAFDIILTATSGSEYLIKAGSGEGPLTTQVMIDLGMPRNIDPKLKESVEIITVEGLKEIATKNVQKRQVELQDVMTIIHAEMEKFNEWTSYRVTKV